jgi:NAD(P)-dependent dehydrogenase (short-subunit alcohol dehydrogenase family)
MKTIPNNHVIYRSSARETTNNTARECSLQDLKGAVAFVTGGASGIGLGQAKVLAEENGVKVAIVDVQQKRIDEAKEYFGSEGRENLPVHIMHLDITDRDAYAHAADEVEAVLGPVQLLFNTAGVSARVPAEKATYDDWDWHLDVNLNGVINGIQTFVPRMVERGLGGHIVNTGSLQSFFALPTTALYTTTKFAVRGLTEALRIDLEKYDIGVSALIPGAVRTNIMESVSTRPEKFSNTTFTWHSGAENLKSILDAGTNPVDLARITIDGMRRNDLWIFPYPEYIETVEDRHQVVMEELRRWQDQPAQTGDLL